MKKPHFRLPPAPVDSKIARWALWVALRLPAFMTVRGLRDLEAKHAREIEGLKQQLAAKERRHWEIMRDMHDLMHRPGFMEQITPRPEDYDARLGDGMRPCDMELDLRIYFEPYWRFAMAGRWVTRMAADLKEGREFNPETSAMLKRVSREFAGAWADQQLAPAIEQHTLMKLGKLKVGTIDLRKDRR